MEIFHRFDHGRGSEPVCTVSAQKTMSIRDYKLTNIRTADALAGWGSVSLRVQLWADRRHTSLLDLNKDLMLSD